MPSFCAKKYGTGWVGGWMVEPGYGLLTTIKNYFTDLQMSPNPEQRPENDFFQRGCQKFFTLEDFLKGIVYANQVVPRGARVESEKKERIIDYSE